MEVDALSVAAKTVIAQKKDDERLCSIYLARRNIDSCK